MGKEVTFKEIDIYKEYIEITKNIRLYYEEIIKCSGFNFIALECIGYPCDGKNEFEFSPESYVEVVISGTAYFDGMRHLYFGDEKTDNYGYHYYPNLINLIKVFKELRKLEETYCIEDYIEDNSILLNKLK